MEFMRAISILFVILHCYWFCYEAFTEWKFTIRIVDKILWNFERNTGLFSSLLWTKLFSILFLGLFCLGTKRIKDEKITRTKISVVLVIGVVFFFFNFWLLSVDLPKTQITLLYISSLSVGYIALLMGGVWMSRLLKSNLMDDVFNIENESFIQETRLLENENSINLPTRFYYKEK